MGVEFWNGTVSTPTLALPLQGGRLGWRQNHRDDVPSTAFVCRSSVSVSTRCVIRSPAAGFEHIELPLQAAQLGLVAQISPAARARGGSAVKCVVAGLAELHGSARTDSRAAHRPAARRRAAGRSVRQERSWRWQLVQ